MKDVGPTSTLPSPEQLRHKVLIKGKRISDSDKQRLIDQADNSDDDEDEDEDDGDAVAESKPMAASSAPVASVAGTSMTEEEAKKKAAEIKKKKKSSHFVHPDLSAITFLGTGKVKKFSLETRTNIPCDMMCSYSEPKTEKNMKSAEIVAGWIEHNKNHLR